MSSAGVALSLYSGAAKADEVFFGAFPQPPGCTTTVGDEGAVCPSGLTFNGDLSGTLTVRGFLGNPNTSAESFLTFKGPPNTLDEQGIGQNDLGPGNPCNTPDCEIGGGASVVVTAEVPLTMFDVIVSSVQSSPFVESFTVWAGSDVGSLSQVTGVLNANNCTLFPEQNDVCTVILPTPATTIAVENNNLAEFSDVLLAAVSNTAVPVSEPNSFSLLGMASVLTAAGALRVRRRR